MKGTIKLNESQLRNIIREAISEIDYSNFDFPRTRGIDLSDTCFGVTPRKVNESKIHNIIKESIKKVLNEGEGAEDALAWDLRRQEEEYEAKKVYEKDITISSRLIKRAIKSFFLKPKRFKKEYVRQFFSNNGINPDDIVRVSNYLYNILSQSFNAREYPAKIKRVTYGGNSIPVLSVDILQAARNLCNQYPELFKQEIVPHVIARAIIHDKTYERYGGSYETYYD